MKKFLQNFISAKGQISAVKIIASSGEKQTIASRNTSKILSKNYNYFAFFLYKQQPSAAPAAVLMLLSWLVFVGSVCLRRIFLH